MPGIKVSRVVLQQAFGLSESPSTPNKTLLLFFQITESSFVSHFLTVVKFCRLHNRMIL